MLITRILGDKIKATASVMPVIALTGPRQSGKTTLVKLLFPDYLYTSLENPQTRQFALEDPKLYLSQSVTGLIIDEAQYVPELFSFIMLHVDETRRNGQIILTGSQNFLLLEKITQSLAGRVAIFHLLPFSMEELIPTSYGQQGVFNYIQQGMFPRVYDQQVPPDIFFPSYIQSYVERDVRQVQAVGDLLSFEKFIQLCPGRIGQLFNQSNLANEVGVSVPTIQRWMSILHTGFIAFLLPPYFRNFNKRILKSPKLYFYDTGLACALLRIRSHAELLQHYARGALFENFIIVEMMKQQLNRGVKPDLYFWRDSTGNEIDIMIPSGNEISALEIKSANSVSPDFFKNLDYVQKIAGVKPENSYLIYAGLENEKRSNAQIRSWRNLPLITT